MNILVRNLSEKTVKELRKQAEENNRSLTAELKATGQKFPDSTALIREDRER